jgi:putative oxidoreductase
VQRLFTSFAHGAPGAALLLMRIAASISLLLQAAAGFPSGAPPVPIGISVLTLATALLLLVGLWTPVAGVLAAIAAGWHGAVHPGELDFDLLLGVLGIALALLGPGAWSVDARLFGWKRFEIQNGTATDDKAGLGRDDPPSF